MKRRAFLARLVGTVATAALCVGLTRPSDQLPPQYDNRYRGPFSSPLRDDLWKWDIYGNVFVGWHRGTINQG